MELNCKTYEVDLEDGEISDSSDEVYTPLQRPVGTGKSINTGAGAGEFNAIGKGTTTVTATAKLCSGSPLANCQQMQQALEDEEEEEGGINSSVDSSSDGSSEGCIKKFPQAKASIDEEKQQRKRRKRTRRTVMIRVQPTDAEAQLKRARFKKYNIWTATLEEDALTENMRDCDVTHNNAGNDRNVENYDFSLKRRLNGDNCLKRRLSNSTDPSDGESLPAAKRGRQTSRDTNELPSQRRAVKSRLGHHRSRNRRDRTRRGSTPASGSDNSYEPRHILDLEEVEGREPVDIAREMANKLFEEKDELLVRIVEVLGPDLPREIYKETQRIEADGGMMIINGQRRRTPGGVFLFLLKNHEKLTPEERKCIFCEEQQNNNKRRKEIKAMSRDRKVEELKKRLSEQEKDLPALSMRKDHFLLGSEISLENTPGNLSNPPPSPVGNEQSPEYNAHAINHVISDASPDKPSTSASALAALKSPTKDLVSYDDDFLDVNCADMDFL